MELQFVALDRDVQLHCVWKKVKPWIHGICDGNVSQTVRPVALCIRHSGDHRSVY